MKRETRGILEQKFIIDWLFGWREVMFFDHAREASKRTEPDGFNYLLELIFFLLENKYKKQTVQQVLGTCWGQLFLQKVKKTIEGVAILDLLLTSRAQTG